MARLLFNLKTGDLTRPWKLFQSLRRTALFVVRKRTPMWPVPERYSKRFDHFDFTDRAKNHIVHTVHMITESFVDRAFFECGICPMVTSLFPETIARCEQSVFTFAMHIYRSELLAGGTVLLLDCGSGFLNMGKPLLR